MAKVNLVLSENFLSEDERQRKRNIEERLRSVRLLQKSIEESEDQIRGGISEQEEGDLI